MEPEQVAEIGPLPSGQGIFGELIRHPESLRLTELSAHEASYGLPAHHPPMQAFLGVPVHVRGQVFGNLYLTDNRGGQDFDAADEAVISTLAVAAGVAIDNARLYEEAQRWLRAGAAITRSLLSGSPRPVRCGRSLESWPAAGPRSGAGRPSRHRFPPRSGRPELSPLRAHRGRGVCLTRPGRERRPPRRGHGAARHG